VKSGGELYQGYKEYRNRRKPEKEGGKEKAQKQGWEVSSIGSITGLGKVI
jgi:hypothetical protein